MNMSRKKHLADELDVYMDRIKNGDNFALLRYGDGEKMLAEGRKIRAQEGWTSEERKTRLGKAIDDSLSLKGENVIFGISCPCCSVDDYVWYRKKLEGKNITFANLFVNCNYPRFLERFREIKRDAVVVANYKGKDNPIGNLNILNYYPIGDDCVNFYENDFDCLVEQIIENFGTVNDLLYVFSAGPLSEPLIMKLYENNPNNCYVDFGSCIDIFIHRKDTRPYTNPKSVYAKRNCWMYDPSISIKKKELNLYGTRIFNKGRDFGYRVINHFNRVIHSTL